MGRRLSAHFRLWFVDVLKNKTIDRCSVVAFGVLDACLLLKVSFWTIGGAKNDKMHKGSRRRAGPLAFFHKGGGSTGENIN